jgi:hypothetical protein
MTGADSGLRFWVSYVEHSGGLADAALSGNTLVVLPGPLQAQLGLPETLTVTGDPEVAREDGALLLAAGHPVLTVSAEAVLAGADVGRGALAWPGDVLPAAEDLLEQARDSFPVDHGRIDLAGPPTRAYLPVLRAGAMISYLVAGDEAFQERAECWLDADTCCELPYAVRDVLDTAWFAQSAEGPGRGPDSASRLPFNLERAVDAAHTLLHARAAARLDALAEDGHQTRTAEIARTEAYYRDVLDGIERRRAGAAPDRVAALDARAEATRHERTRRLAEIQDKHRARLELTPYRLHLLLVPSVVLPVDVLRGSRHYPQRLAWIWPARRFRDLPCPSCGSDRPLVAGKHRLGCEACLARQEPPAPTVPSAKARPAPAPAPTGPSAPARPSARTRTATVPAKKATIHAKSAPAPAAGVPARPVSPSTPPRTGPESVPATLIRSVGDRLVTGFWQSVAGDDRQLTKRLLPDSPAATALRLFGVRCLASTVGVPVAATLVAVSGGTRSPGPGRRFVCDGLLQVRGERTEFPFSLVWRLHGNQAIVDEILPRAAYDPNTLGNRWVMALGGLSPRLDRLPGRPAVLDPVAARLTDLVLPAEGLSLLLRCLTAWWRLDVPTLVDGGPDPDVMAAAVLRLVSWRCGARLSTADCAQRFDVTTDRIKAAEAGIKARLRLGPDVVW